MPSIFSLLTKASVLRYGLTAAGTLTRLSGGIVANNQEKIEKAKTAGGSDER
jgi:hypothetical protein